MSNNSEDVSIPVPVVPIPVPTTFQNTVITNSGNMIGENIKVLCPPKNVLWNSPAAASRPIRVGKNGRLWDIKRPQSLKQGVFSTEEKDILTKAIQDYAKEIGLTDLSVLTSQDRSKRGCWSKIATCLPHRTVRSVYNHGLRMLQQKEFKSGRWSADEVKKMCELHAKHGRKWKLMSQIMNRDPNHIRNKFTRLHEKGSKKEWTNEEDDELTKLVQENHKDLSVLRNERVWPMFNIQWHKIRQEMTSETRTREDLKRRWQLILKKKLQPNPFSVTDDIQLARAVKKVKPKTSNDLKAHWSNFGLSQSAFQIKERWEVLSKKVRGHESMDTSALTSKILEGALFRFESTKSKSHCV